MEWKVPQKTPKKVLLKVQMGQKTRSMEGLPPFLVSGFFETAGSSKGPSVLRTEGKEWNGRDVFAHLEGILMHKLFEKWRELMK